MHINDTCFIQHRLKEALAPNLDGGENISKGEVRGNDDGNG